MTFSAVHARERRQGVPGPGRVGRADHRRRAQRLVAGPGRPRRGSRPSARARTCSRRGSRAASDRPRSRTTRLEFAQCIRENGVKDFPDPANGRAARRHEPHPVREPGAAAWTILNAAMQKCGDAARTAMGDAVKRKPWVLAARPSWWPSTVGVRRARADATAAAQAAPANTVRGAAGRALLDGLAERDPDLPGASGRLAVRRDQPGPRDLHQAARRRRQGRLRRRALPGGRRPGAAAVRHGPGLPRPARGRSRARTSVSSTATCALGGNRFTAKTKQALKKLQRDKGVHATGSARSR